MSKTIDPSNTKSSFSNKKIKREVIEDGITFEVWNFNDGSEIWYKDGKYCRYGDRPAITRKDGGFSYYVDGVAHREDGPSFYDGKKCFMYHYHGKFHNVNGPAIERPSEIAYYYEGKLHRIDGPAWSNNDGEEKWYFNGQLHRIGGPAVIEKNGTKLWYRHGKLHRTDGPAIEKWDTTTEYYIDGVLHNDNGWASKDADDTYRWYVNGQLHNTDGPAVTYIKHRKVQRDEYEEYWIEDVKVSEAEFYLIKKNKPIVDYLKRIMQK